MMTNFALLLLILPSINSRELICGVPGVCQGAIVDVVANETLEDCLQDCKSDAQCHWYSYMNLTTTCWLYENCPTLDESIDTVISGQKECEIYTCNTPGFCQGDLIDIVIAQSVQGCLKSCQVEEKCAWFSYQLATKACYFFGSCCAFDDSIGDFISGQQQCKVENSSRVIVIGGHSASSDPVIEVLDLNASSDQDQCSNVNITFPIQLYSGATGAMVSNTPLVCGGTYYDNDEYQGLNQGCYKLVGNEMTFIGNMSTTRNVAGSMPINDSLWLIGGRGRSTTEYMGLNGFTKPGPDLPDGSRYRPCILRFNKTLVVLAGGRNDVGEGIKSSFFYNEIEHSWSIGPEINSESIAGQQCSLFKKNEDLVILLISFDYYAIITAEILNLNQPNAEWKVISTWQNTGSSYDANLVTTTENSRAFLLGINDGSNGYKDIYELICEIGFENCNWIKTDKQLQVERPNAKATFELPGDSGIC